MTRHGLLSDAVSDMHSCISAGHEISMSSWYFKEAGDSHCTLCIAGCWLLRRHGDKLWESAAGSLSPLDFPGEIGRRLHVINNLRQGDLGFSLSGYPSASIYEVSAFRLEFGSTHSSVCPLRLDSMVNWLALRGL